MGKTASLPGVSEEIPELTKLAEKYVEKRDERMALGKKEVELKQQLIALMKTLNRRGYYDQEANIWITLESQTTIKVKVGSDEEEDEE
jgi:hypothetical protein